jgi:hypothetical protein
MKQFQVLIQYTNADKVIHLFEKQNAICGRVIWEIKPKLYLSFTFTVLYNNVFFTKWNGQKHRQLLTFKKWEDKASSLFSPCFRALEVATIFLSISNTMYGKIYLSLGFLLFLAHYRVYPFYLQNIFPIFLCLFQCHLPSLGTNDLSPKLLK